MLVSCLTYLPEHWLQNQKTGGENYLVYIVEACYSEMHRVVNGRWSVAGQCIPSSLGTIKNDQLYQKMVCVGLCLSQKCTERSGHFHCATAVQRKCGELLLKLFFFVVVLPVSSLYSPLHKSHNIMTRES